MTPAAHRDLQHEQPFPQHMGPERLVIEEQGVNLQSTRVIQKLGRGPSTVRRSLGALLDKKVLREEEKDGGIRMRFEDPFLAEWIRRFAVSSR